MNHIYIDTETMTQFRHPNIRAARQYAAIATPRKGVTDMVINRRVKVLEFYCELHNKELTLLSKKPPFFIVTKKTVRAYDANTGARCRDVLIYYVDSLRKKEKQLNSEWLEFIELFENAPADAPQPFL